MAFSKLEKFRINEFRNSLKQAISQSFDSDRKSLTINLDLLAKTKAELAQFWQEVEAEPLQQPEELVPLTRNDDVILQNEPFVRRTSKIAIAAISILILVMIFLGINNFGSSTSQQGIDNSRLNPKLTKGGSPLPDLLTKGDDFQKLAQPSLTKDPDSTTVRAADAVIVIDALNSNSELSVAAQSQAESDLAVAEEPARESAPEPVRTKTEFGNQPQNIPLTDNAAQLPDKHNDFGTKREFYRQSEEPSLKINNPATTASHLEQGMLEEAQRQIQNLITRYRNILNKGQLNDLSMVFGDNLSEEIKKTWSGFFEKAGNVHAIVLKEDLHIKGNRAKVILSVLLEYSNIDDKEQNRHGCVESWTLQGRDDIWFVISREVIYNTLHGQI